MVEYDIPALPALKRMAGLALFAEFVSVRILVAVGAELEFHAYIIAACRIVFDVCPRPLLVASVTLGLGVLALELVKGEIVVKLLLVELDDLAEYPRMFPVAFTARVFAVAVIAYLFLHPFLDLLVAPETLLVL